MNSKRYFALLAESRRLGERSAVHTLRRSHPPLAVSASRPSVSRYRTAKLRAAVRAADRKVTKHLSSGLVGDDGAELHKARKAGKRARYAGELGRPVLGKKKAANSVHRYQNLQDILGEHQDAVVAADLPRGMAAGTAGHPDENGFTYGLPYARELDRAEHSRRLAHHWAPKAATV